MFPHFWQKISYPMILPRLPPSRTSRRPRSRLLQAGQAATVGLVLPNMSRSTRPAYSLPMASPTSRTNSSLSSCRFDLYPISPFPPVMSIRPVLPFLLAADPLAPCSSAVPPPVAPYYGADPLALRSFVSFACIARKLCLLSCSNDCYSLVGCATLDCRIGRREQAAGGKPKIRLPQRTAQHQPGF